MSNDHARDLYELHRRMRVAPSGSGASRWFHAAESVSSVDLCAMYDTAYRQERALDGVIVDRLHAAGVETRGMLARVLELRMGVAWRVVDSRVEWTTDAWGPSDTYGCAIDMEAPAAQRVQTAGDVTVVLTTGGWMAIFETRLRHDSAFVTVARKDESTLGLVEMIDRDTIARSNDAFRAFAADLADHIDE